MAVSVVVSGRVPIPNYVIDLDVAPSERWADIIVNGTSGGGVPFNRTFWQFYEEYVVSHSAVKEALFALVAKRGPEADEEFMEELEGIAFYSRLPVEFVQGIQMLYELQTLMVPIVNFTGGALASDCCELPAPYEALGRLPWRGPGCTGVLARVADGSVAHARNLDFAPMPIMHPLVFTGVFVKRGVEVFRSQMMAGYAQIVTAAKMDPKNGFSLERNTRYPDHVGGNAEMLKNLLAGRPLNGWVLRKIAQRSATFVDARAAIAEAAYASTEYAILGGVGKGVILAKDPDAVAHEQVLGEPNGSGRSDYVIMTNFDFFFDDVREYFDPTSGCLPIEHPKTCPTRRVNAQNHVDKHPQNTLTPQALFAAIDSKGTVADTVFQAIIDVQTGLWNVSQPDLAP